jgi:DNA-binding transcriptional MerR regulator
MPEYYSTKEAAELTGASRPIIRTYTQTYRRWFSSEGSPAAGMPRKFTHDDLRLIRFVYESTNSGIVHTETLARLEAGALETFAWQPSETAPTIDSDERFDADPGGNTALIPIERLQAAQALMQDAQRREAEAAAQLVALQDEVQQLTLELGKAQGELLAVKASRYRAPAWVRSIFGGRSGE